MWRIYYSSKAFHTWFKQQNLESLKHYIECDKECVAHFLRGLYDSEISNYRCRQLFLFNNNTDLPHYVQYLLKKYFNTVATGLYLRIRAGNKSVMSNGKTITTRENNYSIQIGRNYMWRDSSVKLISVWRNSFA